MPKYYIDAGEFKTVIDRIDHQTAAIDAFKTLEENRVDSLACVTIVSEEGFDSDSENDWYYSTMELLEQSNQIKNYER